MGAFDVGYDDLVNRVGVAADIDLDTNTPGGSVAAEWQASGYATDEGTVTNLLISGLSKGGPTAQSAAHAAQISGEAFGAACVATGVGATVAPLCGLGGAALGAIASLVGSLIGKRAELESDLEFARFQADRGVTECCCIIARMYRSSTGKSMTMEKAGWLLKKALASLGYQQTADKIWGTSICSNMCWSSYPCSDDVAGGYSGGRSCWRLIENWWMLKKKDYGSCVDSSDYKTKDLCGTKDTCRDRIKRMGQIIDQLGQATSLVLASLINVSDEFERAQRDHYLASSAAAESAEAMSAGASGMAASYAEYQHRKYAIERLIAAGFLAEDATVLADQRGWIVDALVLLEAGFSHENAAAIAPEGHEAVVRALWWHKYWIWVVLGTGAVVGGSVALYSNRDKLRGILVH